MVMDVFWRRLCVSILRGRVIFICSELANGATSEYIFRAANVWMQCGQYFVILSCC